MTFTERCRQQCANTIRNTHSGRWLGQALDRIDLLEAAIANSDLDVSPCMLCSEPVAAFPDGMPMCSKCAEKEAAG